MKKVPLIALLAIATQVQATPANQAHAFAFVDALIWRLQEGGGPDNWAQEITPVGAQRSVQLLDIHFPWHAGYRLGAGFKSQQRWDTVFSFTHFRNDGDSSASVNTGGVYSSFLGNFYAADNLFGAVFGPNYGSGDIHWRFTYNTLDAELGYALFRDPVVSIRGFLGLKTAWIKQAIHSNWANPTELALFTTATEDLQNDFWGIGPSAGVDTTWPIFAWQQTQLNLIGNISGALMVAHWSFSDQYQNNTPAAITINSSSITGAAAMGKGLLGLEWIYNPQISIKAGYEAQVWFNQLQYYNYNMGRLNNLLSLQGATITFAYQFE